MTTKYYLKTVFALTIVATLVAVALPLASHSLRAEETATAGDPVLIDAATLDTSAEPVVAEPIVIAPDTTIAAGNDPAASTATPELTTDKDDYHPGETATIFGKFFQSLQSVVLKIFGSDKHDNNYTETIQNITTDETGLFSTSYTLDDLYRPFYEVVATDLSGNELARTMFRDAAVGTYDQCSNDLGTGYTGGGDTGCKWINGNLNPQNSIYFEGDATVQRLWLDGLAPGSTHTVTFQYGTTKSGKHAYDFLTTWDWSEDWITEADRCQDIDGCATASENAFTIPDDPNTTNIIETFVPGTRDITMRGGTITGVSVPTIVSGDYTDTSETAVTISYTVDPSGPMCLTRRGVTSCGIALWFGAHVSDSSEWTAFNGTTGATSISGSPYHVSLDKVDGASVGERDNQMAANTIVVPQGGISGVKFEDLNGNGVKDASEPGLSGWTINLTGTASASATTDVNGAYSFPALADGSYTICEVGQANWTQTFPASGTSCPGGTRGYSPTLSGGNSVTNQDFGNFHNGSLTITKVTAPSATTSGVSFAYTASGAGLSAFNLDTDAATAGTLATKVFTNLGPGAYGVTETPIPAGWSLTGLTCDNAAAITGLGAGTVDIAALPSGAVISCTYTNTLQRGSLTLQKTVIKNNGGTALDTDWTLSANGPTPISGVENNASVTNAPVNAGNYDLSESAGPAGYTNGLTWVCTGGTMSDGDTVNVAAGGNVTCVITNNDNAPSLTLNKITNYNYGGTAPESAWMLSATGPTPLSGPGATGSADVVSGDSFDQGTYTLSESAAPTGYLNGVAYSCVKNGSAPVSGNSITLALGDTAICSITNTDQAGHLIVHKVTNPASDTTTQFSITASGGTIVSPTPTQNIVGGGTVDYTVHAGTYAVSEAPKLGWDITGNTCTDVVVPNGGTGECTITNTQRGHIIIQKNAVPDSNTQAFTFHNNFGNGNPSTFDLTDTTVAGLPSFNAEVLPSKYAVTEDAVAGWQSGGTSCDSGETVDDIDVAPGETVTCTFTNEKLAKITLVKNTIGGNSTFDFVMTGATLPASALLTTVGGTASQVFSNINPDNTYSITETPIPAGWANVSGVCDNGDLVTAITPNAGEEITCTFTNNKPAAQIDLTPLTATNKVGDNHIISANVQIQNGDDVWGTAANGTIVTFTITNSNGATAVFVPASPNTCATTAGVCSITINSPTAGNVAVHATASPIVLGVTLPIATGTGGENSADAHKDYVDARIAIAQTDTNAVGDPHTFTVTVEQNTGAGFTGVAGVNPTVSFTPSAPGIVTDNCATTGTGGSGQCTVVVNSAIAGVFTTNASANILVNTIPFSLTTNGLNGNSQPAVKTYVDANIQITPELATNEIGDPHTLTGHVNVNDGSGFANAPAGTTINFTKVSGPGTLSASSCLTILATGSCTVTLDSGITGVTVVKAATAVLVGGVTLNRETGDGLTGDSVNATKNWADLQITIDQNSTNEIGHPHTFTVTVKSDPGTGSFGPVLGATVVPSLTGIGTLAGTGTCETGTTDAGGQCTIIVNSTTAGIGTVGASVTVDINGATITRALGDTLSGDSDKATKTWVDARISLGQNGVNEIGNPHTFTGHVEINDGSGWTNALNDTTISFALAGVGALSAPTCLTAGGLGACSVTDTSSTVGTDTVNASVTVSVGGVALTRSTNGSAGNSGPATKQWVDAYITITPDRATNPIHSAHIFTVTLTQVPGGATPAAMANITTNITPTPDLANTTTCGPTVAFVGNTATCSITINSSMPGTFTASASATLAIGGVTLTRATGDSHVGDSGNATKIYEAGALEITKAIAGLDTVVNKTSVSEDFTVTITGPSYPAGHDLVFQLVNGVLQAPTTILLSPLIPGDYTVTEADAGAEWAEAVATSPVSVLPNATAAVTVTNTYVPGSLTVTKALDIGAYTLPVNASFDIIVTGPSYPGPSGTTLTFNVVNGVVSGPQTLDNLIPGAYGVTEPTPGIAWTASGGGPVSVNSGTPASSTITNTLKQPHTTISITSNTQETLPGENVILTIADTNDGAVPLTNPSVTLTFGATTVTLTKTTPFGAFIGGDTNDDGVMDPGETWTWTYQLIISADTTFAVAGHGTDPLGNDISPANGYSTEAGTISVKVIGTTRTLGFWQTHSEFTSYVFGLSTMQQFVGTAPHKGVITNVQSAGQSQLFGGFYAPIAKTTTGAKRNPVDQARIQMLQQLLAAKLNCAAFGCSTATATLIANADAAYAGSDKGLINSLAGQLDLYNNSGDVNAIPSSLPATGRATPQTSRAWANLAFWNLP